jgi:SAM-dependent methyltransferase
MAMTVLQPASQQEVTFADLYGFFKRFVERDTRRLTLLDFGCGRQGYVNLYREHFGRCMALDITDFSHRYTDGVEFMLSDGREIPLPDRSVDVVVAHSVLEHVEDVGHSIGEINRVLKEGGFAYLTVSPLYFSPAGGHQKVGGPGTRRLSDWEHLDPGNGEYYIGTDRAMARNNRGHPLNKLTSAELLGKVGEQPWEILTYRIKAQHDKRLPDFLCKSSLSRVDLYLREFRLIVRKDFSLVGDEIVMA